MNLAFGALVITLLVIPGAIFITLYRNGSRDIPSVSTSFQENLALYLIAAIPIHAALTLAYPGVRVLLRLLGSDPPVIRYDIAAKLLSGSELDSESRFMFMNYTGYILSYILISFILAAVLAFGVRQFVRGYFLDIIYPVIRPNSTWHYFFNGEQQAIEKTALEFGPRRKFRRAVIETYKISKNNFAYVSLAVEHSSTAYLYWGVLHNYRVNGDGLVQITLKGAQRRLLSKDDPQVSNPKHRPLPQDSERFYPIRGAYITFDAREIKSINVEFYRRLPKM